jgi:hypothetical protein
VSDDTIKAELAELERLKNEGGRPLSRRLHLFDRLLIRTGRLAVGGVLILVALYIGDRANIGNRPIGSLTLNDLAGALLFGAIALALTLAAAKVAFGEYDREAELTNAARESVAQRKRTEQEQARLADEQARMAQEQARRELDQARASQRHSEERLRRSQDPEVVLQRQVNRQALMALGMTVLLLVTIGIVGWLMS